MQYAINKELWPIIGDVDADYVSIALRELDFGNFDHASRLLSKMLQDSRLAAVLDCRTFNLMDSQFGLISEYHIDDTIILKSLKSAETEIKTAWIQYLMLGVGLCQIIPTYLETDINRLQYKICNYDPYGLRYDIKEDVYFLITSLKDQDNEEKKARLDSIKRSKGYLYSAVEYSKNFDVEIISDNSRWLILENGYRGYKQSFIKSLAWDWLAKRMAEVEQAKWQAKAAGPIVKLKVPAQSDPTADKDFAQSVRNVDKYGVIVLPQIKDDEGKSYDAEYLESNSSTGYESYEHTISLTNCNYAIRVLSNNLSTEIQAGTQSATTIHRDKELQLAKSDKQYLLAMLNDQLLKWYKAVNNEYYDGEIVMNIDSIQDIKDKLAIISSISATNAALKGSDYQIQINELISELGISWILQDKIVEVSNDQLKQIQLAPTDVGRIIRVREARAAQGLPPLGDARDDMTLSELESFNKTPELPENK